MASRIEAVSMNIRQRHLIKMDGIGQHRLSLTVLVGRSIGLKFRSLGILFLIILEITYKESDRCLTCEMLLR